MRGRQALAGEPQHGQVRAGVSPGQGGGCGGPVRQGHGDVLVAVDGVIRRDDYSLAPVDAARGNAAPGVDRHDGAAPRLDRGGEFVR